MQPGGAVWLPLRNYNPDDAGIDVFIAHRSCENLFTAAKAPYTVHHMHTRAVHSRGFTPADFMPFYH